jgi:hypothetical protein
MMPIVVPCGETMAVDGAPVSDTNSSKTVPVELFVTLTLTWASAGASRSVKREMIVRKRSLKKDLGKFNSVDEFTGTDVTIYNAVASFIPRDASMSSDCLRLSKHFSGLLFVL